MPDYKTSAMTAKKKDTSKPQSATGAATAPTVGLVSLGCPKALVDSERILTQLRAEGYKFSPDYDGADVVIVNTCGFLDSAKEESLNAIGEALNENGKVIVTGCMGAKPEDITKIHPKVLSVTGPHQYEAVVEAVHAAVPPSQNKFINLMPQQKEDGIGIKLTPRHYAYLKISEGCNNRCSFCIIPSLRGDLVSRPVIQVLAEAERLVKGGVKELLVISQDTSAYGVDTKYQPYPWKNRTVRTKFIDLCRELGELGAWVRLHYVYPYPHVDEVFELMNQGKVLPYIDIPFQHASPSVLKAMKRPGAGKPAPKSILGAERAGNQEKTLERIKAWRKVCPDLTIRSTFIVGFPGETEEDFQFLLDWMQEAQIDRAGCFKYEAVKGAKANEIAGAVPEEIKEERFHRFMTLQQEISAAKLKEKIGKTLPVIIDEMGAEGYTGRTQGDAPEIDGCVYVTGKGLKQGDIVNVKITGADEYDLFGEVA